MLKVKYINSRLNRLIINKNLSTLRLLKKDIDKKTGIYKEESKLKALRTSKSQLALKT